MYGTGRRDGSEFVSSTADESYVPWYSEEKSRNEHRAAKRQPLVPLPKLQWVRVKRPDGRNVTSGDAQMVNFRKLGFVAMGLDDLEDLQRALGAEGLELPPTAHVDSQTGLILRDDLALFYVDNEQAEFNRKEKQAMNDELIAREPPSNSPVQRDYEREKTIRGTLSEIEKIEVT
jgi:hypothetical protein